jgi:hypothetical protein
MNADDGFFLPRLAGGVGHAIEHGYAGLCHIHQAGPVNKFPEGESRKTVLLS